MARPRLLILDEPTAGLTAAEVAHIGTLLRSVKTEDDQPLSVVLIEHNVPFVFSLCDRVSALDKGGLIACGTPAEVRAEPAVIQSYLGAGQIGTKPVVAARRASKPEGAAPILEVSGLCAGYGRMIVVRDVNLTVREGELTLLYGRNGAGKSTVLNSLVGYPRPISGEVRWLGERIDRLSVSQIVRRGIGLTPQERGVISGQSVKANLQLSTVGLRLSRSEFEGRLDDIFRRFPKLEERRDQAAGTLSGGERQMLALAKVLIRRPRLIILDEPTIGLAPTIIEELRKIVAEISSSGMSLIVAEQNVGWIAPLADRAHLLENGRIVASGRPDEIIREKELAAAYLGDGDAYARRAS